MRTEYSTVKGYGRPRRTGQTFRSTVTAVATSASPAAHRPSNPVSGQPGSSRPRVWRRAVNVPSGAITNVASLKYSHLRATGTQAL